MNLFPAYYFITIAFETNLTFIFEISKISRCHSYYIGFTKFLNKVTKKILTNKMHKWKNMYYNNITFSYAHLLYIGPKHLKFTITSRQATPDRRDKYFVRRAGPVS